MEVEERLSDIKDSGKQDNRAKEESNSGEDLSGSELENLNSEDEEDKVLRAENARKYKYGIIYLSYIPEGLNVKILKEIMSQFGEVGRVYLEPEKNNKKHRTYIEGWVEFKKKRVAKAVAAKLNGTPLKYGRKHCKMNGQIWSMDYMHRFKWDNLTEQLAHDRAVKDQKRTSEMSQAKRMVDFYQKMTEQSKKLKKTLSKPEGSKLIEDPSNKKRIKSIQAKQKKPVGDGEEFAVSIDEELLSSIFKKVS